MCFIYKSKMVTFAKKEIMKKIGSLVVLIVLLFSCNTKTDDVSLSGEIKGLGNDTIFLYGINDVKEITEYIPVSDDRFSYTFSVDTITQAILMVKDIQYPVYFDKGDNVKVQGDISVSKYFQVEGNQINEDLTSFFNGIAQLGNPSDSIVEQHAETFIRQHQTSPGSIYLLDRYFIQKANPNLTRIKELISLMDGTLQDQPYVARLNEIIEQAEKVEVDKTVPTFSFTDIDGKKINRYDYRNKYLILNFWASWCDSCKTENTDLKRIYRKYRRNEKVSMIGISLDMDRDAWKQAVKADTLQWAQVADMEGWDSNTVKQFNVLQLPFTILIDTNGKIIARGISGKQLESKLEELLK